MVSAISLAPHGVRSERSRKKCQNKVKPDSSSSEVLRYFSNHPKDCPDKRAVVSTQVFQHNFLVFGGPFCIDTFLPVPYPKLMEKKKDVHYASFQPLYVFSQAVHTWANDGLGLDRLSSMTLPAGGSRACRF